MNVDRYREVGTSVINSMDGKHVFGVSFERKNKAINMDSVNRVKVDAERSIDSGLLFQRMLMIAQTSEELSLKEIMCYELSPCPPALFENNTMMLKADKPPLANTILDHVNSNSPTNSTEPPNTDHYVFDRGSCLHRLPWEKGTSYDVIARSYVKFVTRRHFRPTVVFDCYNERKEERKVEGLRV